MSRVVAFIQARAGGTRFPGKVFAPFRGRPIIAHVIERTLAAVPDAYILCPEGERDLFVGHGVPVIEGPEEDVLARFVKAANELGLAPEDIIARITADDPLKQPELIKMAVARARACGVGDTNHASDLSGWGAQAFTVSAMRFFANREHVVSVLCPGGADATVDTPADLARLEALCATW